MPARTNPPGRGGLVFWEWMRLGILIIMASVLLTACDKRMMFVGSSTKSKLSASYKLVTGTEEKKVKLKSGEISFRFRTLPSIRRGLFAVRMRGIPDLLLIITKHIQT